MGFSKNIHNNSRRMRIILGIRKNKYAKITLYMEIYTGLRTVGYA